MINYKTTIKLFFIALVAVSCSKNDTSTPQIPLEIAPTVINKTSDARGFKYKTYYQETANANNRKGIIILAHGDGGNENDATLNDQCNDLAKLGYVAVTSSYRASTTYSESVNFFKVNMESIITALSLNYTIPENKTILGGLSKGGNLAYFMFLPAANGFSPTTKNLKGAALMCAGADTYRGTSILKPVIVMCNKIDSEVGITNAYDFKTALQNNTNANVKTLSECLIFDNNNVDAHCSNTNEYKAFLIKKVQEWLP